MSESSIQNLEKLIEHYKKELETTQLRLINVSRPELVQQIQEEYELIQDNLIKSQSKLEFLLRETKTFQSSFTPVNDIISALELNNPHLNLNLREFIKKHHLRTFTEYNRQHLCTLLNALKRVLIVYDTNEQEIDRIGKFKSLPLSEQRHCFLKLFIAGLNNQNIPFYTCLVKICQ